MTALADELKQLTDRGEEAQLTRVKALLKESAASGARELVIGEFYYSKHSTLGEAKFSASRLTIHLSGPIDYICNALASEGVEVTFTSELRYKNHPKGGGVVTIATATW